MGRYQTRMQRLFSSLYTTGGYVEGRGKGAGIKSGVDTNHKKTSAQHCLMSYDVVKTSKNTFEYLNLSLTDHGLGNK